MTRKALVLLGFLCLPLAAAAQTPAPGEPPETVRMRLGPLYLNPTMALTNLGVDNNVFNEPDQLSPKSDFTLTMTPAADYWVRFGRTWINGAVKEDLVYYNKYESERAANTNWKMNWLVPFNRLTITPGMLYVNTRERPGFEVDARSQRTEFGYTGSLELRALSKTFVGATGERRSIDFDSIATFEGVSLRQALSRTTSTGGVTLRHELTPLTSLTLDVTHTQDRFDFSPLRDSDSTQIYAGVKFDPFALIKGSAKFGYRQFRPVDHTLPDYHGSTAAVDLSYVALGTTRLGLGFNRDVQYSFDINQPYYLQTGINGSIQQQIFGPVDVALRAGAARLDYKDRVGAVVLVSNRLDHVRSYGGGVGYHMGRDIRIGFNVDKQTRESPVTFRPYDDLRFGMSVTYGS